MDGGTRFMDAGVRFVEARSSQSFKLWSCDEPGLKRALMNFTLAGVYPRCPCLNMPLVANVCIRTQREIFPCHVIGHLQYTVYVFYMCRW